MEKGLPLNRIANVTVTLSARAAQGRNFGSMLIWVIQPSSRSPNASGLTHRLMILVMISGWTAKSIKPLLSGSLSSHSRHWFMSVAG